MSTQDPTISKRSQNLRQRHKAEGDKSCLLWLSPTTQARVARLKRQGETLAQLVDRALSALEKNRQDVSSDTPGVANSVAERHPEDRQRVEVWVPDDLVDSLRAFLLGGVANSVAEQRAEKDRQGEKKTGQATPRASPPQDTPGVANLVANQRGSVAKSVATQRLVAQAEELRAQGVSFRDIARHWNAKGIPTPSGRGQWHGATVGRLVNTE
jgi:Recombinase